MDDGAHQTVLELLERLLVLEQGDARKELTGSVELLRLLLSDDVGAAASATLEVLVRSEDHD